MKRFLTFFLTVMILTVLSACGLFSAKVQEVQPPAGYSYVYESTTAFAPETTSAADVTEPTTVAPESTTQALPPVTQPSETLPPETQPPETAVAPTLPPPTDAPGPEAPTETAPTEPTAPYTTPGGQIDLHVTLPDANGTMAVSTDPDNVYIRTVNELRGLDVSLLAAVYSVPESGQNYVFEFRDAAGRTASDLRRVYLIDAYGKITSVAAVDGTERENISSTENWFCMTVLIKGMIFPKVASELAG